jgi:hypothetical protein
MNFSELIQFGHDAWGLIVAVIVVPAISVGLLLIVVIGLIKYYMGSESSAHSRRTPEWKYHEDMKNKREIDEEMKTRKSMGYEEVEK